MRFTLAAALLFFADVAVAQDPGIINGPQALISKITNDVRNAYAKGERPMVLFDCDGTLFDNRPRHLQILKEYAASELKGVRPEDAARLDLLTVAMIQYRLPDTLAGLGVTDPGVTNNAAVYWSQRFFSDDYLKYDEPPPGAVNFVRSLYSNGARIVYLSGRDQPRQLMGTVKSLRDKGYPIGIQGTELIMKPTMNTQDAIFKQQVTNYLRQFGKVIATFDNEPANANVYKRAFASNQPPEWNATIVLYETQRSPSPPPLLPDIIRLPAFQ